MLRSARRLSLDEQAFHPCPRDRSTVMALLAAASRKRDDAMLEAACEALGAGEGLFDRVDAIRDVRNQKYTGISRSRKDYEFSLKVLDEFAQSASAWFAQHHAALLKS